MAVDGEWEQLVRDFVSDLEQAEQATHRCGTQGVPSTTADKQRKSYSNGVAVPKGPWTWLRTRSVMCSRASITAQLIFNFL